MASNDSSTSNSSTYGGGLKSKLASGPSTVYAEVNTTDDKNPKYKDFQKVGMRKPEVLSKNSIALSNEYNNIANAAIDQDKTFGEVMYAPALQDKPARLRDYRTIAANSEVSDILDEICDECITIDGEGDVVKLTFRDTDLDPKMQGKLIKEFRKYVGHYNLEDHGFEYFRRFFTEGECFFEHIIHDSAKDRGVLGVVNLPADLMDPVYNNIQNMLIKGFLYRKPIFAIDDPKKVEDWEFIPFQESQIAYFNNGTYSANKEFISPFLENCRRAYRQLTLIEDSIVIHRMVHAPLRFIFNVSTGRMNAPQSEAYIRKLRQQYWSSKTFDVDQNDVVKRYNPQSMTDSYWFAQRQGQDPTSVTEIGGNQNYGSMDDLTFFLKKLYRSLKTPTSKLDPDASYRDGSEILQEELKFARMIIRQQRKFGAALKRGFWTHLKLRNLVDELSLTEDELCVEFNPPTNFYDMRESQKLELKINTYNSIAGGEGISETFALKKYLGWADKDIIQNRSLQEEDAKHRFVLSQIETLGPNWKTIMAQGGAEGGGMEAGGMAGGAGGAGGGGIPDFGGAAAGGDMAEEMPIGGEEAPMEAGGEAPIE